MPQDTIDTDNHFNVLLRNMRDCRLCAAHLPLEPNPIFQLNPTAQILIASQAPGIRAHNSGIPFNDPSGNRLRQWMGISREVFYDATRIAILPMGFCYPGTGKAGDDPPRPECAITWRETVLAQLPNIELILTIGQYAQAWHLGLRRKKTLTQTVTAWQEYWPRILVMPHPSPRNNRWLQRNPWFEQEIVPIIQQRISTLLQG